MWHICKCNPIRIGRSCLRGRKYFDLRHIPISVVFCLRGGQKVAPIFVGNEAKIIIYFFHFILHDVYLKITWLQNIQSHQKIMRNGEIKYVIMKKLILHATPAIITVTKRYMHLWHVCLSMMNVQVKVMVRFRI